MPPPFWSFLQNIDSKGHRRFEDEASQDRGEYDIRRPTKACTNTFYFKKSVKESVIGKSGKLVVGASGAVTAKGTFVTGYDEKKQKDITYSATCSTVLIPTAEVGRYRVYLYFPPKSGKFDGCSGCVTLRVDDGILAVEMP